MSRVVVIGAGAAGLSAAGALAPLYDVTVVEGAASPGGVAASLSCKSDAECGLCAACTVPDLAAEAAHWVGAKLLTSTELDGAEPREGGGWRLHLSGEGAGVLDADAVVLATGLDIVDGSGLSEYGAGALCGVVTALEFDRALRAVGDGREDAGPTAPLPPDGGAIAFIQCACSRDVRHLPYCSRICCAYTARLAMEARRRLPNSKMTVFYMDLQRANRVAEVRMDAAVASEGITYVRSRPACVQHAPAGRLAVVYEDTSTGEPLTQEFDRVVLATGMVPSKGTMKVAQMLGLGQNAGGFIATIDGAPPGSTSAQRVFAAGGATGPVDVVEASAGGLAAAAGVMRALGHRWQGKPPRVLVVGGGLAATQAVETALAGGANVEAAGAGAILVRLDGEALAFMATLQDEAGTRRVVATDVVVLAPSLTAPPSASVPLSEPYERLGEHLSAGHSAFALVMDTTPRALLAAREILAARPGAMVHVLHRDLTVSQPGMQELQLELASAGVLFHRYLDGSLEVGPVEEGEGRTVTIVEDATARLGRYAFDVDVVIAPGPTPVAPGAADAPTVVRHAPVGIPTADRVGASPVLTSRRGVYTPAPATGTPTALVLGGAAAAATALAELARGFPELDGTATVDEDACAACLNCLRMCPHDALVFDERTRAARVLRTACQACGMCSGVCPAKAITLGAAPAEGGG